MSPYDRVVAALNARKSRRMGDNWQCPSHDDRTPSLSVSAKVNRESGEPIVVLHCHAGCSTTEEILPALGIEPSELFGNGHRQQELFPASRYSPVGLDIILKLQRDANQTFIVASALGRYVSISGGREHVYSQRHIAAVIVEAKHRRAVIETLGITNGALRKAIAKWKEWGVAHGCSQTVLTIFVREGTACPICKASLTGDAEPSKAYPTGDTRPPQPSLSGDGSVPASEITEDGFFKGVRALEYLKEDEDRRRSSG